MRAKCRTRTGSKIDFEVLDLSLAGCMLDCRTCSLKPGDSLFVRFDGLESLAAEVLWVENGKAGLEFEQLLHETVFERLGVAAGVH
ncbi:PilZ domain-containing protein [Tsuneonella mangrovi]|uniref:PilZ domain-containing protein n=1 Tax=Tsuneonella mangrovi TaxID=1982042 RepID=UPI00147166EF|nr:PilZ domain-containing protein [Tsuneonella mangrovi]